MSVFAPVFWFKVITMSLIYLFVNARKRNEYYYYQNLGVSKTLLWTSSLILDFSLFFVLIIASYKFR